MKIEIFCVGKLKEKYWTMAVEEYQKRLGRYCSICLTEVSDEKAPEKLSPAEEAQVKRREGEKLLRLIKPDTYVTALAIEGKKFDSEGFAAFLDKGMVKSGGNMAFVIGGSLGLDEAVMKRADAAVSFSDMTFPHQLMRVILLEQIYRGFRILKNEPYHK